MQKPGRDGHFFLQTNKRVDIYIVAGDIGCPPLSLASPRARGHQSLSMDLALVAKRLPGKTVENIAQRLLRYALAMMRSL